MAKRGRPKSKPIPKWNPKYSKMSVKLALQNALTKRCYGDLSKDDKAIIHEILSECDQKVLDNQNQINLEE